MKYRPKEGLTAFHEGSDRPIDPEGETLPDTAYYRRRIADGDLEPVPDTSKKRGAKDAPAPKDPAPEEETC